MEVSILSSIRGFFLEARKGTVLTFTSSLDGEHEIREQSYILNVTVKA
jgi:hypothetical protein